MIVDKEHGDYDLDMEVLCCLPCEPVMVPQSLIVRDLQLSSQKQLRGAFKSLELMGAEVITANRDKAGRCVTLGRKSWWVMQPRAHQYYTKVYGLKG